jgi:hypothetical protein
MPIRLQQSPRRRVRSPGQGLPAALQESAQARLTPTPSPLGTPPVHFSSDPNSIVTVNVATVVAPTPNTYQQCGCFCSFGATSLPAQDVAMLTQLSDLDNATNGVLIPPDQVKTATWAAGELTVTGTNPAPAGWAIGQTPQVVLSGFVLGNPNTWPNGVYTATITAVGATPTFTVPITTDPGAATVLGTWQLLDSVELSQMATTYFAQGNQTAVWVLELGAGLDLSTDATALNTWLKSNPRSFYNYLLPRKFGATTAALDDLKLVLDQYQNPEAMTYFTLTVVPSTMTHLGPTYKDVVQFIEAPSVTDPTQVNLASADGEFSAAAMFYNALNFVPSQINRIAPMAFKYLYGVTPYPTKNNGPLLSSFKSDFTNYVSTGAEGGISNTIVYEGVNLDGTDYFNWWWTIDFVQIFVGLNLSNAIINGSNNPLAPLYYDQDGIDYLLAVLAGTMVAAQQFGMVVGPIMTTGLTQPQLQQNIFNGSYAGACNCNAVPFLPYSLTKPGDYKIGEYDGLSTLFIPARGFIHILVTVTASQLIGV